MTDNVLDELMTGIEDIARESGGAPSGVLYAGFMAYGITLDTYLALIARMVGAGRITVSGDVIRAVVR